MTRTTNDRTTPTTLAEHLALPYRLEITPDEFGGYVVRYPELLGCVTQVERIEDAIPMAREILTGWLEIALEDGMEIPLPHQTASYSGKFLLRMPKSLHRTLAEKAEDEGVSLNQYAVALLAACHPRERSPASVDRPPLHHSEHQRRNGRSLSPRTAPHRPS